MSRDGTITREFGDGEYVFRMVWSDLMKLQESRDTGPLVVLERLRTGLWKLEDIREVIRIGLLGGGMEPTKVNRMVKEYVEAFPPMKNWSLAFIILASGLTWDEDETEENKPPGKTAAPNGSIPGQTGNSASEPSSNPGP